MVRKYSNCDRNTGNTVRKKLASEQLKYASGKGSKISNLKYYSHRPDFDGLLSTIEENIARTGPVGDWQSKMQVKTLLEYFIDLNDDISDGMFQRDYIPTLQCDLVEQMVNTFKELCGYQTQIHNGDLDLGLGPRNGISITLSVYENGEFAKFGHHAYTFDTNRSYAEICQDFQRKQKEDWKNDKQRSIDYRSVQRKMNYQGRGVIKWEPDSDDFEYPFSEEISITVIRSEPTKSMLNALQWSSIHKPEPSKEGSKKAYKKSSHQKVANWSYHHNIDRKEIKDMIDMYHGMNTRYLARTKTRQALRAKRFSQYQRRHPEMIHINMPEIKFPVGLWPDDVARIKAQEKRLHQQVKRELEASAAKNSKKKGKKGKKPLKRRIRNDSRRAGDTFLTHVSFVDDYEYVDSTTKENNKVRAEELKPPKPETRPRITRTLQPWEFVDELLHHSEPEMKVVFKDCEVVTDLGNLTLSPPPPSLKPSLKERPSSKASSEGDDDDDGFPLMLGLPFVVEEQTKEEVSEISSQAHGDNEEEEEGGTKERHRKSNKTNGRTRRKRKQKQEALRSARTVSFTEGIKGGIKGREKSGRRNEKEGQGQQVEGHQGETDEETRITLSRQVSVHTKDNTQAFVESLSDHKYEGIQLKLQSSNLKPSYLVRKFGNEYQEASTFPRILSIDVTEKIIDVVKLFRKTEQPFSKPIASLVLKPNHGSCEEITSSDDNLGFTTVSLFIKADVELASFEDLYLRMKDKLKYNLIYPITNVVGDFVQIYKLLPYTSYLQPRIIPTPLPKVDERVRSQLDWLYALCHWKFDIYPAEEAYTLFHRSFQVTNIARPTTSRLCRIIDSTPNLALRSCDIPTCYNSPVIQLLSCQHSICSKCIQYNILRDLSRKQIPFTCWIPGCQTTLDPVCLQYMLSLPLYKLQQVYLEDLRIQTHPLWQWCPKQGCGRVVKLSGAGFLDNGVVILCDCGTVWCFHCRREGHWPASCDQAKNYFDLWENDYKDFKETKNLISGSCPVIRVLCTLCSTPNIERSNPLLAIKNTKSQNRGSLYPETKGGREDDNSGLDSGFGSEESSLSSGRCECVYEVCRRCVQTGDSAISVPQVMLEGDEGISPSTSQPILLPLLYYHSALLHHQEKQLWSWASVEIRTSKILQQIKKSKTRIVSSSPTSMRSLVTDGRTTASKSITPFSHHGGYRETTQSRGSAVSGGVNNTLISENTLVHLPKKRSVSNRPRTSHVNLSHTMETEKFFLVLVQQFIQQGHVLLEYVYVYLMEPQSTKKTPEIIPLVISLEGIMKQIQQLLSSMTFSSSSVLTKLHKLHDAGNKLVVAITTTFKNTNVNSLMASKNPTFCKSHYSMLPPIGHKYTKVKFVEPRGDRNPTFI